MGTREGELLVGGRGLKAEEGRRGGVLVLSPRVKGGRWGRGWRAAAGRGAPGRGW